MELSREAATSKGPAGTFTGEVWIDPITLGLPPRTAQCRCGSVLTRTTDGMAHSHESGQTVYVTEGRALFKSGARSQEMVQLNPGDVAYAPDGEEHWHGARTDHFMTHLSITDGAAHWGSHVTDHEYQGLGEPARAGPSPRRPGSRTQTDPGTKSAPFGKDPRSGILASWGPRLGQVPAAPPILASRRSADSVPRRCPTP